MCFCSQAVDTIDGGNGDGGADRHRAVGAGERRRHREAAGRALPRDRLVGGAAQPAAGAEQGDRLEQVGLAGAVVADEGDEARHERERQRRVVAEVGELQGGEVDPRRGVAGRRRCGDRGRQTRIGMST